MLWKSFPVEIRFAVKHFGMVFAAILASALMAGLGMQLTNVKAPASPSKPELTSVFSKLDLTKEVHQQPISVRVEPSKPKTPPVPPSTPRSTKPKIPSVPPAPPSKPKTVASLTDEQTANAISIVETAKDEEVGRRGTVIALATALQESTLLNYANSTVPQSLDLPHEAVGKDHDSVGLFQQRPGPDYSWGSVDQCMDPKTSTKSFLKHLKQLSNWHTMPVTVAAQKVQGSAYPSAYAKHQPLAEQIVDRLL